MSRVSDLVFIDALLFAYRRGAVRREEQKIAMLAAAQAADDSLGFMTAMLNFGIERGSQLHRLVGEFLAAPAYYRAKFPLVFGLPAGTGGRESFLRNQRVLFLVEGVLTRRQQQIFFEAYWWFVDNHEETYFDARRGRQMGAYANEPKDNASTLQRFERYLQRLKENSKKVVRERYEDFPADVVVAILRRAFVGE